LPGARQTTLEHCDSQAYDWIFAIDSLEHNENFGELLTAISQKLAPGGVLVLSGPTESGLYRLGRRIAGFAGGYHKTNIYDIEQQARRILRQVDRATIFPGLCLFSLSAWQPLETTGVHHN
jgi:2-polyprenyl-3-methyl-5-hydroxy-6-metoxy-1,4-benzoquinol methylase